MPTYDREGLQVAYLAHLMPHYLDLETGEVIDVYPGDETPAGDRYRRIPSRTDESEGEDRRVFVESLKPSPVKDALAVAVDDPTEFRRTVSYDRMIEKAWYSFKNDRASEAIEAWLGTL
ncbi:MAG TPA: hypothetical protein VF618_01500 [Thermoanaerobaculia bacterium]